MANCGIMDHFFKFIDYFVSLVEFDGCPVSHFFQLDFESVDFESQTAILILEVAYLVLVLL